MLTEPNMVNVISTLYMLICFESKWTFVHFFQCRTQAPQQTSLSWKNKNIAIQLLKYNAFEILLSKYAPYVIYLQNWSDFCMPHLQKECTDMSYHRMSCGEITYYTGYETFHNPWYKRNHEGYCIILQCNLLTMWTFSHMLTKDILFSYIKQMWCWLQYWIMLALKMTDLLHVILNCFILKSLNQTTPQN